TFLSTLQELFSVGSVPGFIDVLEFQNCSETDLKCHVPVDTTEEVVLMLYTSGTTGHPKAVEISHKAYVASCLAAIASEILTKNDVVLAWSPITHVSGLLVVACSLCLGARLIIEEPLISYNDFLETLRVHQISAFLGVPERMRQIVNEVKMSCRPTVGFKKILVSGTNISKLLGMDICDLFGVESFVDIYGLTEACGFVSYTPVGKITYGNVGLPSAGTKVKVIDLMSGDPLGSNKKGEIVVQGLNIMKGYYGRPEATRDVLSKDGWFRTGDIGYYDDNGQIYVVDRLKQMIKCMGNVVTSAELEEILMTHEAVLDAAVVGIPSSKYGEAPVACVVVREYREELLESLKEELKELIAGQTSFHKHLHGGVVFMKSLPKSENGKILRQELKSSVASMNM
ncbi:unnamed protein product, partial [Ixodes hexagonus]